MQLPRFLTFSLVTLLMLMPLSLTGIDYYVNQTGDNELTVGTFRHALANVVAGEYITFDPTVFSPTAQGVLTPATKYANFQVANVTIDATGLLRGAKAGVTIDGGSIGNVNHEIILFNNATGQHVFGIRFRNGNDNTVQINSGGGDMTFKYCTFDSAQDNHGLNSQPDNGIMKFYGCHFGTNSDGVAGLGNNESGLRAAGAARYIIGGGADPRDACVFGNNGQYNLRVDGAGDIYVTGNFIGTNSIQTDLGATEYGLNFGTGFTNNAFVTGNTLGFNTLAQVRILGGSGSSFKFASNYLGVTHDAGTWKDIGDGSGTGLLLTHADSVDRNINIGSSDPSEANYIGFIDDVATNGTGMRLNRGSVTIQGNYIGTNPAGDDLGNRFAVSMDDKIRGVTFGGANSYEGNILGFSDAAQMTIANTFDESIFVSGNYIGVSRDSVWRDIGGGSVGISVDTVARNINLLIGGVGAGNYIGNHDVNNASNAGIYFNNGGAEVLGNFIGTDSSGTSFPNANGIIISGSVTSQESITLGNTQANAGNYIGLNTGGISDGDGIRMNVPAHSVRVMGNFIGTDSSNNNRGNGDDGIDVSNGVLSLGNASETTNNRIGENTGDDLVISGGSITFAGTVDVNGDVNATGGSMDMGAATLTISDNITLGAGVTFLHGTSTVTMDSTSGTTNVSINTNNKQFNNLYLDKSSDAVTASVTSNLYVSGDLVVEGGVVSLDENITLTMDTRNGNANVTLDGSATDAGFRMSSGATITSDAVNNRYSFQVRSGGYFDALHCFVWSTNEGVEMLMDSRLGSVTFDSVTFNGVGATNVALDISDMDNNDLEFSSAWNAADSSANFFDITFNGAAGGTNILAGAAHDFVVMYRRDGTGEFGTLGQDGASAETDPNNRVAWTTVTTWVDLIDFKATGQGEDVLITWETAAEGFNEGFHLYRSEDKHGTYLKLNDGIIPPVGGISGGHYSFLDTSAEAGVLYHYKLEDIDTRGQRTMHGPISVDWDGDGLPDEWEIMHGFDPTDPSDALLDSDGDGLSNLEEFELGLDPRNADSDGDGIPDGEDSHNGYDPETTYGINVGSEGFRVIAEDPFGITLELCTSEYEVVTKTIDGQTWDELYPQPWSPEHYGQEGEPRRSCKRVLMNVHPNRSLRARTLLLEEDEPIVLENPPIPVPTLVQSEDDEGNVYLEESYVAGPSYEVDEFLESSLYTIEMVAQEGDNQVVLVRINNEFVNPHTGEHRLFGKIRVRLDQVWDEEHVSNNKEKWRQWRDSKSYPDYISQEALKLETLHPQYSNSDASLGAGDLENLNIHSFYASQIPEESTLVDCPIEDLKLFWLDKELPFEVIDVNEDGIFNHGQDHDDCLRYMMLAFEDHGNEHQICWLVKSEAGDGEKNQRFNEGLDLPTQLPEYDVELNEYREHVRYHERNVFEQYSGGGEERWMHKTNSFAGKYGDIDAFYEFMTPGIINLNLVGYEVDLSFCTKSLVNADPDPDHEMICALNGGSPFTTLIWDGLDPIVHSQKLSAGMFHAQKQTLDQDLQKLPHWAEGEVGDKARLIWIEASYMRRLEGYEERFTGQLKIEADSLIRMTKIIPDIDDQMGDEGDHSLDLKAMGYRVFDGYQVKVKGQPLSNHVSELYYEDHGDNSLSFVMPYIPDVVNETRHLLVVKEEDFGIVDRVSVHQGSDLHEEETGAEYLIISHPDLWEAAENLRAYRESTGLSTKLISIEDIKKTYAWGFNQARAVQDYVQEAYWVWDSPPRYLVIAGSSTWDHRYTQSHVNWRQDHVIPGLVTDTHKAFASDWVYARTDGDHFPDISVGRMDVQNNEELQGIVNKIMAYEAIPAPEEVEALLLGDSYESYNVDFFAKMIEEWSLHFTPSWMLTKLYLSVIQSEHSMRASISGELNEGDKTLVVYNGHGSFVQWSEGGVYDQGGIVWRQKYIDGSGDIWSLDPQTYLPFVLEANCVASDFYHAGFVSLGSQWLNTPERGAIGVIGTAGISTATSKSAVMSEILKILNEEGAQPMGDILRRAKVVGLAKKPEDPDGTIRSTLLIGCPYLSINWEDLMMDDEFWNQIDDESSENYGDGEGQTDPFPPSPGPSAKSKQGTNRGQSKAKAKALDVIEEVSVLVKAVRSQLKAFEEPVVKRSRAKRARARAKKLWKSLGDEISDQLKDFQGKAQEWLKPNHNQAGKKSFRKVKGGGAIKAKAAPSSQANSVHFELNQTAANNQAGAVIPLPAWVPEHHRPALQKAVTQLKHFTQAWHQLWTGWR